MLLACHSQLEVSLSCAASAGLYWALLLTSQTFNMALQSLKHVSIQCDTLRESPDRAFGDGTGIIVVAETSTGCLLGASGIGERGVPAEQIACKAADELVEAVYSGACVDQW